MSEAKKCPWGVPAAPIEEAPSLSEVMSEQLADDLVHKQESRERLQQEEDQAFALALQASISASEASANGTSDDADIAKVMSQASASHNEGVKEGQSTDCKDDLLIAQMLQMQFDNERHNHRQRRESSQQK